MRHYDEGHGVIIKHPYVTHMTCPPALTSKAAVISKLNSVANAIEEGRALEISYTMMQPRMECRTEAKVVCFNGTAMYIATTLFHGGSIGTTDEMLEFAEKAIRDLAKACPFAILDGLVRVDIFRNKAGQLVVNEFESLEADFAHNKKDGDVFTALSLYWFNKCSQCLDEISSKELDSKKRKAPASLQSYRRAPASSASQLE